MIVGFIFIGLSLLFSFSPLVKRSWGLNDTAFFDPWMIILFYLLLLFFWFPQTNRYIVEKLCSINKNGIFSSLRKYRYVIFILAGIVAGICFYLLKIKYIFLGDTDIRAKQIEEGIFLKEEYLTMLSLKYAYRWLHEKFAFTGVLTIRLLDYISGSIFIFLSLCIANLLGNTCLKKLAVFFMATLSLAALLLFCGYTEIYALPALFLLAYLYAALLYLKGKVSVFIPVFTLLTGIGFHLMLVAMFPSLFYLVYFKALWKYPFFRKKRTLSGLVIIFAPFLYVAFNKFAHPMMLPLQNDNGLLTLFSSAHYVEFFNSQMLGAGIGFLIWLTTLVLSVVHKIKYDAKLWFFQIASLSVSGMIFVFRMDRGSGDWDICSFAPIVYNAANACFLISVYERKLYRNIKYGILMIAGFSVLHTSAWIFTNKSDASIQWLETAFSTDPANYYKTSFHNESMLSAVFSANDLPEHAIKWGKKAYLKYPNDHRTGYNYANLLIALNRSEEGYAIMEQLLKSFPGYALPYTHLIAHYVKIKDYN
ncbi:MAG: hypothetical protein LBS79_02140, partial [Tannerella sp.]|nr:hypothetical protein [Tannerella sp.]